MKDLDVNILTCESSGTDKDCQRLLCLYHEYESEIDSLQGLYNDGAVGFRLISQHVGQRQQHLIKLLGDSELASESFQDQCSISYKEISGLDISNMSRRQGMKQGDVKSRVAPDGDNILMLGSLCIVRAVAFWEVRLRKEIAVAIGAIDENRKIDKEAQDIINKSVTSDVWADLCKIRNSMLHHGFIANNKLAKCKIMKWFTPGDKVELDGFKMIEVFKLLKLFGNHLHSASFPPRKGIKVPGAPSTLA